MDNLYPTFFLCMALSALLAPLGCILLWRRMTFFADGLAHSVLLGIGLALSLKIHFWWGLIAVACIMGLLTSYRLKKTALMSDTWLFGVTSIALAIGIILNTKFKTNISAESILFGDILMASSFDLKMIWACAGVCAIALIWMWSPLLMLCVHSDLAIAEGTAKPRLNDILVMMVSIAVVLCATSVGALFVPAFLILPAMASRSWSSSPEIMLIGAVVISMTAHTLGVLNAFQWDLPTNATIVLALGLCVLLSKFYVLCQQRLSTK